MRGRIGRKAACECVFESVSEGQKWKPIIMSQEKKTVICGACGLPQHKGKCTRCGHCHQTYGSAKEIRPLSKVLGDIREVFDRDGIAGVEGFTIAIRTEQGNQLIMSWGSTRSVKLPPLPPETEDLD